MTRTCFSPQSLGPWKTSSPIDSAIAFPCTQCMRLPHNTVYTTTLFTYHC